MTAAAKQKIAVIGGTGAFVYDDQVNAVYKQLFLIAQLRSWSSLLQLRSMSVKLRDSNASRRLRSA